MNFSNYGYRSPSSRLPSTTYSSQFSSTPSNPSRFLGPRFGYSSIPSYPRPRSSASKPNPDSFSEDMDASLDNNELKYEYPSDLDSTRSQFGNNSSNMDSMRNNYGSPNAHVGDSFLPRDNLYSGNNSFQSPNSSAYYSCNDTFSESASFSPRTSVTNLPILSNEFSPFRNQNSAFGIKNGNAGRFQKKSNLNFQHSSSGKAKKIFPKKINSIKKKMATKMEFRCSICSIDFTSSIPFEMHLRGARHAKKIKTQDVYKTIQKQVAESKDIASIGNSFRCELCNVHANSSLQFQTHLDGTKHKNKVLQMNQPKEKKEEAKVEGTETTQVNGKSNGSTVRTLPAEFGEPQPSKLAKYACDICSIIVNSETQLQQHLTSKKHKAKVEGKPLQKKKTQKKPETEEPMEQVVENADDTSEAPKADSETKTVVGVKNLSSSFIAGETLQ